MTDTDTMHPEKAEEIADGSYKIGHITDVVEGDEHWSISMQEKYSEQPNWEKLREYAPETFTEESTSSSGFGLDKKWGVEPKVGDIVRMFNHQGMMIHGIDINDVEVFYQDRAAQEEERQRRAQEYEETQRREFEEAREQLDADYEALPDNFKKRIDKFRNEHPDWRWEWERYEMSCCVDAVKVANWWTATHPGATLDPHDDDAYKAFRETVDANQAEIGMFEGHSGNSMSVAVMLAWHHLTQPWLVYYWHGALTPMVGCTDYHCPHPYDPDGRLNKESEEATDGK